MGAISIEQLFPASIFRPDDSSQIGTWSPPTLTAMCVGFMRVAGERVVFEGETPVEFRLVERAWHYLHPSRGVETHISNRWRLEIVVNAKESPVRPGYSLVVTQYPYSLNWIQAVKFKMYSKKNAAELQTPVVPPLDKKENPVDWLERNLKHDPWETGAHYVAGISFPNGFQDHTRNTPGTYVFGACPDFEQLIKDMFAEHAIQDMLYRTRENRINFWYSLADIKTPPSLYPVVIEEAETLMGLAIQQALAGPSDIQGAALLEDWTGQPVSKLVRRIYCAHLNNRNKRERLLQEYEGGKTPATQRPCGRT